MRYIAIYGDVNANIIDGSAVWLRNITHLASRAPNVSVDVFLKAQLERDQITAGLRDLENVTLHEPELELLDNNGTLPAVSAAKWLEKYHQRREYSAIIIRGKEICLELSQSPDLAAVMWAYVTDIPQQYHKLTSNILAEIEKIVSEAKYFLCQTEEIRNFISSVIEKEHYKLRLLPPIIPDEAFIERRKGDSNERAAFFYSGKFAPSWAIETLVDSDENLYILVAGDKFHNPKNDPWFEKRVKEKLLLKENVEWMGAVKQPDIFNNLRRASIGFAWRKPDMDGSLELSTKLLEYAAAGLAVIANPTPAHKMLLGENYPYFASDEQELSELLKYIDQNPEQIADVALQCKKIAEKFAFSAIQPDFNRMLQQVSRNIDRENPKNNLNVVVAGHDLKFARELLDYFESREDVNLAVDQWKSLRESDDKESMRLAQWADLVFCEWCAGNAVWYSHNINPKKTKLFVRFHRVELLMEFAPKLNMEAVSKVLFVGPHFLEEAMLKFGWPKDKLCLLPNFVDTELYKRDKFFGSEFNLGMIGFVPKLKRLDRALDVLGALREKDSRYTLFIKGDFPWNYPWIWRKSEERDFYEKCFERIRDDERLQGAVVFDRVAGDVPTWLRKIGVILSVSELESFHMALAEGIASGAFPILWNRDGASEIFPWLPRVESADDLQDLTVKVPYYEGMKEVAQRYDKEVVASSLDKLINDELFKE